MLVGIHNRYSDTKHPDIEIYKEILKFNDIDFVELNCSDPDFWDQVSRIDRLVYKWSNASNDYQIAQSILPVIENHYMIKCFPNQATCWHYDDKIRQYYLLKAHGFPIAESYVFWHKKKAKEWIGDSEYPLVHKTSGGSGSTAVSLVKNVSQARRIVNRAFRRGISQNPSFIRSLKIYNFNVRSLYRKYGIQIRNMLINEDVTPFWKRHKNYVLFQKFYPNNRFDTRVQITGARGYAFVRYNRKNDFRASGSNDWSIDKREIDMRMVEIAFEISKQLGFQSMAYDFVYDEDKNPVIVEISYCYGDYPEFSTGYWDEGLTWHDGRFWPQYFELMDLLERPDLKQPEMAATSEYTKAKIKSRKH